MSGARTWPNFSLKGPKGLAKEGDRGSKRKRNRKREKSRCLV